MIGRLIDHLPAGVIQYVKDKPLVPIEAALHASRSRAGCWHVVAVKPVAKHNVLMQAGNVHLFFSSLNTHLRTL